MFGQKNIEKNQGYILCPNHISNWDPPVMVASIHRNDLYVLAKEELFINSFVKWLAKKTKIIPVKRGKQDLGLLKNSTKILKENHIILMFPEGTRNGIEKRGKIQNGAVLMSLMSGAKVVPIGMQARKKYKLFSKVKINIGKPMDFSEYKDKKNDKETLDSLSKKLMEEMIRLTSEDI
ncbi:MAG: 1-acyl-sn-glycerol-3-phosphate acyltransferase [Clostridia bacterium]|nr:1-acyl-sn-glycerol-3-phosphate acyltransferase [Clostridia bacterium]